MIPDRILYARNTSPWVPGDFIWTARNGTTHTEDATDYALPVSPGDRLSSGRSR